LQRGQDGTRRARAQSLAKRLQKLQRHFFLKR
jgi:hypothetical protein